MRIVLAGASGLIGSALKDELRAAGHSLRTLVRRATDDPDEDRWDPSAGRLDPQVFDGVDAVICLSGVGVGDHRWNDAYKEQILRSRVDSVATIARTLAAHGGPRTFVCASAVGYYGDTGERTVDESAPPGDRFLSDVCVQWEAAAEPARAAGLRVPHLRTGLVLDRRGGLLKPLSLVVRAGVGGRLGSGRQYMPWISMADEVGAIRFVVEGDLDGPVNLTAPNPVTNREFTKALGSVLHRPTVFPVPGFAAHLALGEFAGEALTGQRAVPTALLDAGYAFTHRDVTEALRAELA